MSLAMKVVVQALRLRPKPLASAGAIAAEVDRDRPDAEVPRTLLKAYEVRRSSVEGMPVITLTPRGVHPAGELLYTHGGAYVHPLVTPHWHIIGNLGLATPLRVTVPLYALAPEHTGDETYPKLHKLYDSLTASGLPVIAAGDSGGGALAMALVIRARDEHLPLPDAVLLFSPCADATLTNPDIPVIEPRDPMLGREGALWAMRRWAGDRPLRHPWLSPVNDSLRALPRICVFHGERDILCPDAKKMVAKAKAVGTNAEINLYPDAFHVFVGVPQLPESRAALAHAREIIKNVTAT
ncbi:MULTISPECIES: alpha/beta hydrolase fold domain-containing protein [Streptomyces]|uniref:Alpha/beta hydrolase n=1 Tax=Streptomyces rochei TaxID=1928 RepID=A0AAX3ZSS0_STRRO|nr:MULTISPECIES: alpha/beta hydrolase [Streptomyces]RSS91187.1 alpha/beta hydrolase [Streptomyces sp. WAC02707]WMC89342.1 alpha/beta hydrolase [Streptomyces rochei]